MAIQEGQQPSLRDRGIKKPVDGDGNEVTSDRALVPTRNKKLWPRVTAAVGIPAAVVGAWAGFLRSPNDSSRTEAPPAATAAPFPQQAEAAKPPVSEAPKVLTVEEKVRSKSAETMLGSTEFGYSDDDILKLKEKYGEDLSIYRHTIVVGDPNKPENVNTVFNFRRSLEFSEAGYKATVEAARGLAGSKLSGLNPFKDTDTSINAQVIKDPNGKSKIVAFIEPTDPVPAWTKGEPNKGLTDLGNDKSIVRSSSAAEADRTHRVETLKRELSTMVLEGSKYGPILSAYPAQWYQLAVKEVVVNSAVEIASLMATKGLTREEASAQVGSSRNRVPNFKELIAHDPLNGVPVEKLVTASIWN
ncbi:MAG TPA: hypothetical protein VM077_02720 [Candidatus Limnocylindrales bacterium]|nr:hypothetical protein [Candidatus Limnocylindrales bacterium]